MLHKLNKPRILPESYLPILPIISKVFERHLHLGILPLLANLIRREEESQGAVTTPQLLRVITQFTDAANKQLSISAVLLDVSKSFDRVYKAFSVN